MVGQSKTILRVSVLCALICCLVLVSRNDGDARRQDPKPSSRPSGQSQAATVTAENGLGSPLVLSGARPGSDDLNNTDVIFSLTNVSAKKIRAYVIRQTVESAGQRRAMTVLTNLELTKPAMLPNQSQVEYSSYEVLSDQRHAITLAVEYVEFSDGTTWGTDSGKAAEVLSGERAAVAILSEKLISVLKVRNTDDVFKGIDLVASAMEAPAERSEMWKRGFQKGRHSVVDRLKRAGRTGGWIQIDAELHQLARQSKGVQQP